MKNIENLDVLRVFISDKKKDSTPITDFRGNPARKVSIKTTQYGERYMYSYPSSKQDDPLFQIKERTQIQAIVWESNGFLNFKLPTKLDLLEQRVSDLEAAVFEVETEKNREFASEELAEEMPDF